MNFKVMPDSHGRLELYRKIHPAETTAIAGWEKIVLEKDFAELRSVLDVCKNIPAPTSTPDIQFPKP